MAVMATAVLASCGGTTTSPSGSVSPTATPTPTPTATPVAVVGTGAADPVTAVKALTGATAGFCTATSYLVPPCPVTQRLGARVDAAPFSGPAGGAGPLCRCQNQGTLTIALISQSGLSAYVHEDLGFGPPGLRWTLVEVGGTWYVDDQDTGCSSTSIYNPAYDHVSSTTATAQPSPPSC